MNTSRKFFSILVSTGVFALLLASAPVRAQEEEGYILRLKWKPVTGIASYSLQIGTSEEFVAPEVDTLVQQPEFEWEPDLRLLKPGQTVYFRIASVDANGVVGSYSGPRQLKLPELSEEEKRRVQKTQEARIRTRVAWSRDLSLRVGPTQFVQSSQEVDLKSVALAVPYLSYGLSSSSKLKFTQYLGSAPLGESSWRMNLSVRASPFRSLTVPRVFDQTSQWGWEVFAEGLRQFQTARWGGLWSLGARVEMDFRWIKSGTEGAAVRQGFSLGPSLMWERSFAGSESSVLRPRSVAVQLAAPVLGILINGPLGVAAQASGNWGFWEAGERKISILLGVQSSLTYWQVPATTLLWDWGIWIAPCFHGFI